MNRFARAVLKAPPLPCEEDISTYHTPTETKGGCEATDGACVCATADGWDVIDDDAVDLCFTEKSTPNKIAKNLPDDIDLKTHCKCASFSISQPEFAWQTAEAERDLGPSLHSGEGLKALGRGPGPHRRRSGRSADEGALWRRWRGRRALVRGYGH